MSTRRTRDLQGLVDRVKGGTYVAARHPPLPRTRKPPSAAWRIYIGADFRLDIGEGPFSTRVAAVEFAENEVGVAWSVRRDGAMPKASDPRWVPETEEHRRRRVAKEQVIIEQNRRFTEEEQRFRREHPDATPEEYRRFVTKWGATNATSSGKRRSP